MRDAAHTANSCGRREARAQGPAHRQYIRRPRLQALQLRQCGSDTPAFVGIELKSTRWLVGGRIKHDSDFEQQTLGIVEDLFLVQYLEVHDKTVRLLAKHRGMGCPNQADHHQDKLFVCEGD